ncbi:MAG: phosphatase PAP2 family protein [Pseudorhodoplanes sp.]|nr:phosphatase PAP2 family protein [Pseudorhodoplanes sp.]
MAVFGLWLIVITGLLTGMIFTVAPELDLDIAALMQDPQVRLALKPFASAISAIRELNFRLTLLIVGLAGAVLLFQAIRRRPALHVPNRMALLVILSFALAPGLLVNGILKEHWSRPRPYSVAELGGHQPFKAWWDTSGACERNCSFVSGEASSAFATLAVAALASGPWQYAAITGALAYGLVVGLVRMIAGGHFLTDVIFAGVLTALIVWLLHGYLFRWRSQDGALSPPWAATLSRLRGRRPGVSDAKGGYAGAVVSSSSGPAR